MREENNRSRTIVFWAILILFLIIVSLLVKAFYGFKKSFFRTLSRPTFLYQESAGSGYIITFEEKSGLVLKITNTDLKKKDLSFPVFGYFKDGADQASGKNIFRNIFWDGFWGKLKTNLNKYDLVSLFVRSLFLENKNIENIDFGRQDTGSFKDSILRSESLSLAIFNSTDHSGMAQNTAKILEAAGGRVIMVTDSPESLKKCVILSSREEESYTASWLKELFGCDVKRSTDTSGRVDYTLIIGEENWKNMEERW